MLTSWHILTFIYILNDWKKYKKKRYVIQKLIEKENPLFTLYVIIRNEVVWISLELSPILPVSDFS